MTAEGMEEGQWTYAPMRRQLHSQEHTRQSQRRTTESNSTIRRSPQPGQMMTSARLLPAVGASDSPAIFVISSPPTI